VGFWERIQSVLSTAFSALQTSSGEAQVQWQTWLTEVWRTEQRLSSQLHHLAPHLPYEQYRQCLETMAQEDARYAELLRERLEMVGGVIPQPARTYDVRPDSNAGGVYKGLQRVLVEKRELYESYRQQARMFDDPGLQALLHHLQQDQERHQEQLIELLMRLDAHRHETIT
jgi:Ferritin-like domain